MKSVLGIPPPIFLFPNICKVNLHLSATIVEKDMLY